jgi:hypothetical protein
MKAMQRGAAAQQQVPWQQVPRQQVPQQQGPQQVTADPPILQAAADSFDRALPASPIKLQPAFGIFGACSNSPPRHQVGRLCC